jgi:hypothetical protein
VDQLAAQGAERNESGLDEDGRDCERNQRGNVWFLAGTFGGLFDEDAIANRRCTIPHGKALFVPIIAFISFAPEFPQPQPPDVCLVLREKVEQIRCDVNDDVPIAPKVGLKVSIDGEPVGDLFAYRVQSPPGGFTFRIVPGSPFTTDPVNLPPGPRRPAVVDGYAIFLKPLSPGRHSISFSADFNLDGIPDLGANYELLVVQ